MFFNFNVNVLKNEKMLVTKEKPSYVYPQKYMKPNSFKTDSVINGHLKYFVIYMLDKMHFFASYSCIQIEIFALKNLKVMHNNGRLIK